MKTFKLSNLIDAMAITLSVLGIAVLSIMATANNPEVQKAIMAETMTVSNEYQKPEIIKMEAITVYGSRKEAQYSNVNYVQKLDPIFIQATRI